ncbi:putative helicase MOV-10 [Ochlerotatus camptorhynchus]|uniref:putative helicase MOV-10 n=1 Tax=Ochlerotatus camptorhynchus TaxID=644619 RepID=UPI0031D206BD
MSSESKMEGLLNFLKRLRLEHSPSGYTDSRSSHVTPRPRDYRSPNVASSPKTNKVKPVGGNSETHKNPPKTYKYTTNNKKPKAEKDIKSDSNPETPKKPPTKHKYTTNSKKPTADKDEPKTVNDQPVPESSKKHRHSFDRQWDIRPVCTIVRLPRHLEVFDPIKDCPICQEQFRSERVFRSHLASAHGSSSFQLETLLSFDPRNERIEHQVFKLDMKQLPRAVPTFMIKITNKATVPVLLNSIYVFDGNVKLISVFSGNQVLRMVPGYCFEEEVTLDDLVLVEGRIYSLTISATPVVLDRDFDRQVVEQYHFTEKAATSVGKRTPIKLSKLPRFEIPRSVVILYKSNFKTNDSYTAQEKDLNDLVDLSQKEHMLTLTRYTKQIHMLNLFEAQHLLQEFFDYTILNPVLTTTENSRLYSVSIDQFKKRPSLLNEEVKVKFITEGKCKMKKTYGVVDKVTATNVIFLMQELIDVKNVNKVMFILNRSSFQLEKNALGLLSTSLIQNICFPTAVTATGSPLESISDFQWLRKSIATNKEQMVAIRNIVNQTSFPAPYILFGPPGTGKTSTLVEAIGQIYKLRPTANILVAAPSNFAANALTSRLLDVIPDENIFRFFAFSCMRKLKDIDWNVIEVSNIAGQVYSNLCYEDIYMCRVVVATLTMAGRLVQADIVKKHFSYVIIDECGSAKEISALMPIAGLATNGNEIHASIVLAGDPKQLGPVIQYDFLKQTVHGISMLERMMNLPLYSKDPITKEYNSRAITQLRDNYRSHDKLLQFCNNQFYDGLLRAKAPAEIKSLAVGWYRLPNRRCPLIFYPVVGKMKQDKNTFSMFNETEARQVMFYVGDLLQNGVNGKPIQQSDIGIVSPYAKQVLFLKQFCRSKKWTDIDIGSAEQYQGREKAIIIISTVRSGSDNVGFLSDVKRLNVTLTRARSLMIVVGNPETLGQDPTWKQFIEFCRQNGAIAQPKGPKSSKTPNTKKTTQLEEQSDKAIISKASKPLNRNGNQRQKSKPAPIIPLRPRVSEGVSWSDNRDQIQEMINRFYNNSLE